MEPPAPVTVLPDNQPVLAEGGDRRVEVAKQAVCSGNQAERRDATRILIEKPRSVWRMLAIPARVLGGI